MDSKMNEDSYDRIAFEIASLAEKERISPKFEAWRNSNYTYLIAEGGRGAGAKTWSTASLIVQKYHYSKKKLQCLCVREFMMSLAESSYSVLQKTIERLGYSNWEFTREFIRNTKTGSYFIFRGLRDLRTAEGLKSYEGFDDLFADEAAPILMESWEVLIPTLRKRTKQIWVLYNRDKDIDPCHAYFVLANRENMSYLHLEPGAIDNPWWNNTSLQDDMEADYKRNSDEADHIWKGIPRRQGQYSVMSRIAIRKAMDRDMLDPDGEIQVGVDVARFGDDKTEMYMRKGLKVIKHKELIRCDTNEVSYAVWNFIDQNTEYPVLIDVGYNPGVVDRLVELGANIIPVNFGGIAQNVDKYTSAADEMWFEFPVDEADIPDDQTLMDELSQRQYNYDRKGRRKIESKDDFKKRIKRSPDKADGLLLAFYSYRQYNTFHPTDYSLNDIGL